MLRVYIYVLVTPMLLKFQICVWSTDGWEKKVNKFLKIPPERATNSNARTRVQFHQDQSHVLVVHETLIAVYEASKLNCIKQVKYCHILEQLFTTTTTMSTDFITIPCTVL